MSTKPDCFSANICDETICNIPFITNCPNESCPYAKCWREYIYGDEEVGG